MPDNVFDITDFQKKANPKVIVLGIVILLIIIAIFSSFYTVDQKEEAVVLRFGKWIRTDPPGLHFKLPLGIDKNYNVPTQRQLKEEFGYRTQKPGIQTRYSSREYEEESVMLTGDLNIIDVEWEVQYKISNPKDWLFNVEDQLKTIRDISQSVINQLVGDRTIFDVMGAERENIEIKSKDRMNDLFKEYGLGVNVRQVKLQNIVPPKGSVQDAFEDVNKAIQDRNRLINEGKEAYNNAIPRARGVAQKITQEAEGYATEKVNKAKGDIARFMAVFGEYRKNPTVTRIRLYYEMIEEVFSQIEKTELIDKRLRNFVPFKSLDSGKKGEDK